jgi:hypothetical protein
MTAINFPDNPEIDDTFTVGDITWKWNGVVWKSQGTAVPGPDGVAGEANFNTFMLMGA